MDEPAAQASTAAADPLESLAKRAAAGDAGALEALLRKLAPGLLGVVRAVVGSHDADAQDALQESLVAVSKALRRFEGRSSVRHYASRIAVRSAMALRKRGRRRDEREQLAAEEAPMSAAGTPFDDAAAAQRRRRFFDVVDTLPEVQAETLLLRVVLGYSLSEVAAATGAPVNTVRSRVRLAKTALRARIEANARLAADLEVGT